MPAKQKAPAPIDRPLSKAYLREFAGWSTAYPPGLSEPNSIRDMRNVMVTREGAARVRPGMRSLLDFPSPLPLVGSHELFYLPTGKAYLVAVRETVDVGTDDEREIVGFRVIGYNASGELIMGTLEEFGFVVPSDPNTLAFTSATTYVKYLQIDNKIFALSNAPEGMVMFWVGNELKAKKPQSITRPEWSPEDKLLAMHPTGSWVLGNVPTSTRTNLCLNPDVEANRNGWLSGSVSTRIYRSTVASVGSYGLGGLTNEIRANYATSPLHDVASTGTAGWSAQRAVLTVSGSAMRITETHDASYGYGYAQTGLLPVPAGSSRRAIHRTIPLRVVW